MNRSFLKSLGALCILSATAVLAATQGGCVAPTDTTASTTAPPQATQGTVVASLDSTPQTRAATGIVKWNFVDDGGSVRHVDGVDANGTLVVGLSMSVATETVTLNGVEQQAQVTTLETSNGGVIRVAEGGTLISMTPDPIGLKAFTTDVEPLAATHPKLTEYGCGGWVGVAICYAECASCGAAPEVGLTCALCVACAAHCFL